LIKWTNGKKPRAYITEFCGFETTVKEVIDQLPEPKPAYSFYDY
jgi:hypothetical protein